MARTPRLHHRAKEVTPRFPPFLEADIPATCRQILLVLAESISSSSAQLWQLEKQVDDWKSVGAPIRVSLGRNGLAWGLGAHAAPPPPGFPVKCEGDGCSPAGIFGISHAFGYARNPRSIRIPYIAITPSHTAIDDPASQHYNQIIDAVQVPCDWRSNEMMLRDDGLYRWGGVIEHNPGNVPSAGSCIFLHLWRSPGHPTAGCTAMAEADLIRVLEWLDPSAEPKILQYTTTTPAPV